MAQHNCDQDCPKLPGSHPVLLSLVIVSPVIFFRGQALRGQQKLQPKKCEELALLLAAPGAVDLNPAHLHKPPVFSWGSSGIRKRLRQTVVLSWRVPPRRARTRSDPLRGPTVLLGCGWPLGVAQPRSSPRALCKCMRFGRSSQGHHSWDQLARTPFWQREVFPVGRGTETALGQSGGNYSSQEISRDYFKAPSQGLQNQPRPSIPPTSPSSCKYLVAIAAPCT